VSETPIASYNTLFSSQPYVVAVGLTSACVIFLFFSLSRLPRDFSAVPPHCLPVSPLSPGNASQVTHTLCIISNLADSSNGPAYPTGCVSVCASVCLCVTLVYGG